MKTKSNSEPLILKEASPEYSAGEAMVRTQIYLTREEHAFIQNEASRLGTPMAAVIRQWIDEKMRIPEDVWADSPLLQPPAESTPDMPEDFAINHDHYLYGGAKKYVKAKGKWVQAAPAK